MYIAPGQVAGLLLPIEIPASPDLVPITITVKCNPDGRQGRAGVDMLYTDGEKCMPCRYWLKPEHAVNPNAVHVDRIFVTGRYVFHKRNDALITIYDHYSVFPAKRMLLAIQNISIQEISVKGEGPVELPAEFADPEKIIREWGVAPKDMNYKPKEVPARDESKEVPHPRKLTPPLGPIGE